MAKDTFYFSHDYNARSDEKVKLLIRKHGILGYGVYWAIVEDLYNNANALRMDCEGIAFDLRVDENIVKSVIEDFDLFVIDCNEFGSMSVQRRLDERDAKSKKARASAKKRWNKEVKEDANAMQTHSERNAIKESKGKEIIYIKECMSPPEGVDALHFYIAKGYHKMFYDYKPNKTLEQSKLSEWVNTVRLLIEADKIEPLHLVTIKYFLQSGIDKEKGTDSFWSDTIYSINALRKKGKDGTYQFDRIKQDAKKWLSRNPDKEPLIYQAYQNLENKVNGKS